MFWGIICRNYWTSSLNLIRENNPKVYIQLHVIWNVTWLIYTVMNTAKSNTMFAVSSNDKSVRRTLLCDDYLVIVGLTRSRSELRCFVCTDVSVQSMCQYHSVCSWEEKNLQANTHRSAKVVVMQSPAALVPVILKMTIICATCYRVAAVTTYSVYKVTVPLTTNNNIFLP